MLTERCRHPWKKEQSVFRETSNFEDDRLVVRVMCILHGFYNFSSGEIDLSLVDIMYRFERHRLLGPALFIKQAHL